ncbi:MAG: cation-translocating P-type ATPase [Lachnospiraceae bacterium]|nr:cation-translocating P-type ATPase [Lachnospiraceae bacterium]
MKHYWEQEVPELITTLQTSEEGITGKQVEENRKTFGENVLREGKRQNVVSVFLHQFCDLLVVILVAAAVISMLSGNPESTLVILLVLVMNALLGTVQHVKAQKSLDSLKQLSSPSAKVLREGQKQEIPSREIVPGDLVLLEAGDLIVADGRIIHNYSLQVNESSLTGEAVSVEKTAECISGEPALGDRKNMVYSGSLVTYGRAEVLVTATGMDTELGRIADLMNEVKERKTPLQVSMDKFSRALAIFVVIISGLVLALCLYRDMTMLDSFMFAVALAVAAIPEALSSIVTIVQAMGTQKMARENAIIKELKAVESLGCVSVICSDKTGTLTQNKMTVQSIYIDGRILQPGELDITNRLQRYLLYDAVLNNDSSIVDGKGIGDPTEYALLEMFRNVRVRAKELFTEYHMTEEDIRQVLHRKEEIPFDSDRKLMSSKYHLHGEPTVLTKGAVDVLLDRCNHIQYSDGICPMTETERELIGEQNRRYSEAGLRVLAFAYKEEKEELLLENEKDFIFIGLVAMVDPPRPEAIGAVERAKRAGIRPVMITGDHKITAVAIAKEIGIYEEGDMALTGLELDCMSREELDANIERISVYARVSPENKIRIVQSWQRLGKIVAMTGDGVNDAPALKKADIGVAMGITGTEVAKDASSMILADDNFATIMKAVLNGRNVYRNIKNALLFLLSGNMAGILAVLYTSFLGLPVPFAPVHLLFINLLTDSLPAIAIGMEPSDAALLQEKPRDPAVGILNRSFFAKILAQGALIAAVVLAAYYLGLGEDPLKASTMAFATLTLARLFHGFNCRSSHSIFRIGLLSNRFSIYAFWGGACLLALVLFVPVLHGLFRITALGGLEMLQIAGLALCPTIFIQVYKYLVHK